MSDYDSKCDTITHINIVRELIFDVINKFINRAMEHDKTKLENPEKEIFDEYTPKLKHSEYMSDDYKSFLVGMKPALDHHYSTYRHHPEHFENGIHDMNLIDLLEMLCDWKASTMRMKDGGDIIKSIEMNSDRFKYGDEIKTLLLNTVDYLNYKNKKE